MKNFSALDVEKVTQLYLEHPGIKDPQLQGLMAGIKARARAKLVLDFILGLQVPPDMISIHGAKNLINSLFTRGLDAEVLRFHFASPGRTSKKADLIDMERLLNVYVTQENAAKAAELIRELEQDWKQLKALAAAEAGRRRLEARWANSDKAEQFAAQLDRLARMGGVLMHGSGSLH